MAAVEEIPGINGAILDLFRAAGILSSGDLVTLSAEELMNRLDEANADGEVVARLPTMAAVNSWCRAAEVFEGQHGGERARLSSDVMKEVRNPSLPTARQMSSQQLREAGIPASQVPIGKLLAEVSAEMEVAEQARRAQVSAERRTGSVDGKKAEARREEPRAEEREEARAEESEEARAEEREEAAELEDGREIQVDQDDGSDRSAGRVLQVREPGLRRERAEREAFSPLGESQPAQRRLEKRNYGMLHRDPSSVYLGAFATLVAMVLAAAGFVAVGVALVYALYFEVPVPTLTLWVLPAFPVALFLHVTLGLRPRCRLCGQQLFRPKSCNKHVKAHRSPFGHIFAVALHVLTRSWFRCMLCGTKQRLRE